MAYTRKDKFSKPHTAADALGIALEKEKSSFQFYKEQGKRFRNPGIKRVFNRLEKEEAKHITLIKKMLDGKLV